jgi:hypothetical protein
VLASPDQKALYTEEGFMRRIFLYRRSVIDRNLIPGGAVGQPSISSELAASGKSRVAMTRSTQVLSTRAPDLLGPVRAMTPALLAPAAEDTIEKLLHPLLVHGYKAKDRTAARRLRAREGSRAPRTGAA